MEIGADVVGRTMHNVMSAALTMRNVWPASRDGWPTHLWKDGSNLLT